MYPTMRRAEGRKPRIACQQLTVHLRTHLLACSICLSRLSGVLASPSICPALYESAEGTITPSCVSLSAYGNTRLASFTMYASHHCMPPGSSYPVGDPQSSELRRCHVASRYNQCILPEIGFSAALFGYSCGCLTVGSCCQLLELSLRSSRVTAW